MSGDCEVMALYLGSAGGNRKGRRARWTITAPVVPANAFLLPLSPCGRGCLSEAKAGEGLRPLVLWRPLTRLEFAALILATLPHKGRGEEGTRRLRRDDKAISPCSRHRLKTPRQNAFLRVQAIFGFVEHHRLR